MLQRILGFVILLLGLVYALAMVRRALRDREALRAEAGALPLLCGLEAAIYFAATLGISDFLLNTLLLRRLRLTEDRKLPGSLVAAGLTPGAVIACILLQADHPAELLTVVLCSAGMAAGAFLGARLVGKLNGALIRKIMVVALICSLGALIAKMLLSAGAVGTAMGLSGWKLPAGLVFSFCAGAINMVGVPMKPALTAFFLLMGLSPLAALTVVLVMCCFSPLSGGIEVIRSGRYHQKTALAALSCGSLGALLGCLFTISVSAPVLNVLLIAVMLVAIVSMLRK